VSTSQLVEKKVAAEDQLKRVDIRAPQDGMVHQLDVHTVGGVVQAGTPVRLQFYRDETVDCSERVVFEDFGIDVLLPAFETTAVEFTPRAAGEFRFRCGMNMLKGLLVVEPAGGDRQPSTSPHKLHE